MSKTRTEIVLEENAGPVCHLDLIIPEKKSKSSGLVNSYCKTLSDQPQILTFETT